MPQPRNYRVEYQRRTERAQEQGFRSYGEKRRKAQDAQFRLIDRRAQRKPTAPEDEDFEADTFGETLRADLGPWAETPSSTRVASFRYDYLNRETQVTWRNQKNPGYAYSEMGYEDFRRFARAVSKGKYINRVLNGFPYRPMTPDEAALPSNRERRMGVSRSRP